MQYDYSLDKIKFTGRLIRFSALTFYVDDAPRFLTFLHHSQFELINEYTSYKVSTYRYNFVIRKKNEIEGSLYFGCFYNGDYRESSFQPDRIVVEFNPNKSGLFVYEWLLSKIHFHILDIKTFDVAFDVPNYSTRDIKIFTASDKMSYGNNTATTYYIAPKSRNSGRVKVYDKHIERKKLGIDIPDTLRIECSFRALGLDYLTVTLTDDLFTELSRACNNINSVYIRGQPIINDFVGYMLDRMTDSDCNTALSMMSYNTKQKYKNVIKSHYENLNIDVPQLIIIIQKLLEPYVERTIIK